MAILIGVVLAVAVGIFATVVRLDRDRAFYPTVMIVIALLYGLFAAISGSMQTLMAELAGILAFITAAVIGFRGSLWVVAAALALHGVYDMFHPHWIQNSGVPPWWPDFCAAYDIVAGVFLGALLLRSKVPVKYLEG